MGNIEKAIKIKELMETLLEATSELIRFIEKGQMEQFFLMSDNISAALLQIKKAADAENDNAVYKEISDIQINCIVSLERIKTYAKYNREKAKRKIEYELYLILRYAYARFFYYAFVDGDENKMEEWHRTEGRVMCRNEYLEHAKKNGEYKYDISITILAYNKLEYTKLCVESVLRNLPKNLKCELILVNNGSSDGTKEYFESIHPNKQFDFKVNCAGLNSIQLAVEGKYGLGISNDVIITPNTIDILYNAFEQNLDYGFAVPMTSGICNLQQPVSMHNGGGEVYDEGYDSLSKLDAYALKINAWNVNKEEIRFRLCNPLSFARMECYDLPEQKSLYSMNFVSKNLHMFPDDFLSMYIRRAGYKNVLMKDIYCHHFGTVTLKDEKRENVNYNYGRNMFLKANGIDPWGRGFCWDYELFDKLLCNKEDSKRILGINCGLGSNILKVQQEIKYHTGNQEVKIINIIDNERYVPDLNTISDKVYVHRGWDDILAELEDEYDYILVCDKINELERYEEQIVQLYTHVSIGGTIILFIPENCSEISEWIKNTFNNVSETKECDICYEIDTQVTDDMPKKGKYIFWMKTE